MELFPNMSMHITTASTVILSREEEILTEIRSIIAAEVASIKGHRVVLFGSRATGKAHSRSDFDIGIDGPAPLDLKIFNRLSDSLEQIDTLYTIDLVDMNNVSEVFRKNALNHAVTLYE
jgi:uncharacterized protein